MKRAILAACLALAACYGDEPQDQFAVVDGPASASIGELVAATPLVYSFAAAGTYILKVDGEAGCNDYATFALHFSFSGRGEITGGNAHERYELVSCRFPARITQRVTIEQSGMGPWQVQILLMPLSGSATFNNLRLSIRQ